MIEPFLEKDIAPFLAMAETEGWICARWEFDFLLRAFPQGCLVYRDRGEAIAFVTSISYGRSGWIGNLIVTPNARGGGIGKMLMEATVATLLESGVETIWLTASEKGAGLYRKIGFVPVDLICRWCGSGGSGRQAKPERHDQNLVKEVDCRGWGGERDALLQLSSARGRFYTTAGGFICCQPWDDGTQIGPWGCVTGRELPELLELAVAGAGERVFLDVPAGNNEATSLLQKRGFKIKGSNVLMYFGARPLYQARYVFALGSMGSMG